MSKPSPANILDGGDDDDDDEKASDIPFELWRTPECFIYKVPPLKPGGHKASDWGLANPHLTGSMRLMVQGESVIVQIFNDKNVMFVACPITLDKDEAIPQSRLEYWVEVVKDSSRYFVIRAVNPATKQVALLGAGFRERDAAFAFQAALRDHFNRVMRLRGVKPSKEDEDEGHESSDSATDQAASDINRLSIKAPIKINIPGVEKKSSSSSSSFGSGSSLLAPPPAAVVLPPPPSAHSSKKPDVDDDEFGDFIS